MRIGLVGAGPWAKATHAPSLTSHPGVEFSGVWARRPEAAAEMGTRVFENYDEMLAEVDAVAFAIPPEIQSGMAVTAAEAGKHVLLDKPIAATLDEAVRLTDAVDSAGVRSMVTLTRRFAPETRSFLAENQDKNWSVASGTWLSPALLASVYADSLWRHRDGAMFDVGPHVFDLLDATLGSIVDVVLSQRDSAADMWTVVLRHEGGTISTSQLSLATPVMPPLFRVELSGSSGVASLTDMSTSSTDCYALLLDEFLASVESGVDHPCSVHRGLHLQRVLEAAVARLSTS